MKSISKTFETVSRVRSSFLHKEHGQIGISRTSNLGNLKSNLIIYYQLSIRPNNLFN
jgi:hypothetical protein